MPAPYTTISLAKLQKQLSSKTISLAFITRMKKAGIQTLQDIRKAGGIAGKENLSAKEQEAARRLEAHAYLNLLSEDVEVNEKLINAGISSFGAIARTNKASFLERAKGLGIPEEQAAALHAKAEAAEAYLTHIITAARAEKASYSGTSIAAQALGDEFDQDCEVKECNSAVSPLAYLAELLVYATGDDGVPEHILFPLNFNTHEKKLAELEKRLCQPFGRFTNACEEVDRKVRQVRIATEVLRKKGYVNQLEEKEYCFNTYKALLTQIGTSYDELRRIKSAGAKKRQALADRLGIPLRQSKPDELDMLLLEQRVVTEDKLEEMFGLQDTRRDPMHKGILSGDQIACELIKDWRITNHSSEWLWGADGRFYGRYSLRYRNHELLVELDISLLNQKNELIIVAFGETSVGGTRPIWLQLEETNNSGITAEFLLNMGSTPDGQGAFTLSVQPTFLAWRLQYLRQQWQTQDSLSDAYFKKELPVIDPDLIGPEDFRHPEDSNAAFRLWKKRRAWVDERLIEIKKHGAIPKKTTKPALLKSLFERKIAYLNKEFTYKQNDIQFPIKHTPWLNEISLQDDLIDGKKRLQDPILRERQLQWIQDHHLTPDSFSRLSELSLKFIQNKDVLPEEEWEEVYSILLQVVKNTFKSSWISEKVYATSGPSLAFPVYLTLYNFWKSIQEPDEGMWSPSLLLESIPMIDPEVLKKDELAAGRIGEKALSLWVAREQKLKEIKKQILDYSDLPSKLTFSLGNVGGFTDWKTEFEKGSDYWDEHYDIGIEDFTFFEAIWRQSDELSEDQADKLCVLLTTRYKMRMLWPEWKTAENEAGLQYWQMLRTRLPKWRASREQRALWQMALKNRSKLPIIDPDLVQDVNIKSEKIITDFQIKRKSDLDKEIGIYSEFRTKDWSRTWGGEGSANGQFKRPAGIAIDKDGNVYVVDQSNKRIQKFTPEGKWLNSWGQNLFNSPENILYHSKGSLYVTDRLGGKVYQFDLDGKLLNTILSPVAEIKDFSPYGIAETPEGNILISECRNNYFFELDENGLLVHSFEGMGGNPDQSILLSSIAIDSQGFIYVVDTGGHRVLRFSKSGEFIASFGSLGSNSGQFKYPFGVTIDAAGMVWVSDTQNNRLQKFNIEGTFLEKIDVSRPYGICIDNQGGIWGTDQRNNQVYRKNRVQGLDELIKSQLGIIVDELLQLEAVLQSGTDITKRLDQIGLSYGAFSRLMGCWKLVIGDVQLEDSEWDEIYNILIQVVKTRELYPTWKKEEQEAGITLSPDYFELPEKPEEKFTPVLWRSTSEDRWDWEDKLQARIDQEKGTYAAMAEAVDKAEERTIAQLRDALVKASGRDAKSLSQELLLDMEISPCQKTTRISVAITTLQKLFFLLQTEQHLQNENFNDLSLENKNSTFEQQWKWLGSYETWRAAVGLFLYPENVLLPRLRRKAYSTPGFNSFIQNLNSTNEFQFEDYYQYFYDICNLKIFSSSAASKLTGSYNSFYIFGLSGNKIYYSIYALKIGDIKQGFWKQIYISDSINYDKIIGAKFYRNIDGEEYIYVFFTHFDINGAKKLSFVKIDTNLEYDSGTKEVNNLIIELEYNDKLKEVVLVENEKADSSPTFIIIGEVEKLLNWLNSEGTDWAISNKEDTKIDLNKSQGYLFGADVCISASDNTHREAKSFIDEHILYIESFNGEISSICVISKSPINNDREKEPVYFFPILESSAQNEVFVYIHDFLFSNEFNGYQYQGAIWNENDKVLLIMIYNPGDNIFGYKEVEMSFSSKTLKIEGVFPEAVDTCTFHFRYRVKKEFNKINLNNIEKGHLILNSKISDNNFFSIFGDQAANIYWSSLTIIFSLEVQIVMINYIAPIKADLYQKDFIQSDKNKLIEINKSFFEKNAITNTPIVFNVNHQYIYESLYFVPLEMGLYYQMKKDYLAALTWFRSIYDFQAPKDSRKIFYGLKLEAPPNDVLPPYEIDEPVNFIDPTDVHGIASAPGRYNSYTRFTIQAIIQTLLQYADSEFTRDTPESIEKALLLYEKAKELLDSPELHPYPVECKETEKAIANQARLLPPSMAKRLMAAAKEGNNRRLLQSVSALATKYAQDKKDESLQEIEKLLDTKPKRPLSIAEMVKRNNVALESTRKKLLMNASVEQGLAQTVKTTTYAAGGSTASPYFLPKVATYGDFPVPWNPLIQMLYLHAENNLNKIRNCRNIAGIKREVEAYAAATDVQSAMPSIGAGGQLVLPTSILPPPVPYRYEFVIDRAKQLVNIAVQMENAFLSALEKKDAGLYEQLKARQDLQLAQSGVKLQNLRLRQAKDEIGLAELQRNSAEIQFGYYEDWINEGLTALEQWVVGLTITSGAHLAVAASLDFDSDKPQTIAKAIAQSAGIAFETAANITQIYAAQERKEMEWSLQKDLAANAIQIGDQQIKIANDGVDITEQEVAISKLQVDQAKDIIEFLREKDTSAELYDWMQGILKGIYSYFLQQATAMAKLAENQLAFERQEPSPGFIQHDYWVAPSENAMGGASENATDRFGLTGSARLLADIYKLDQYHFDTEKRKLQLSKNISLASAAPFEFQRFRETGVITFQTLMQWFDRDFPGHYLRMIKRVRTSVVALVPPTEGVKATLSNIGVSRIVTERNGLYQTIIAHRPPESVALTSPSNATGLFELESQNTSMMLPFEGLGVDTLWEFRMPKASNQFDYNTIADIILSIDYTALDSYDYRLMVIESLPRKFSGDRPYSFRYQFADAWYDLHNPDQSATPMTVTFRTRREDFPPNLERVTIQQVLLYFALKDKAMDEQEVALTFLANNGESVALGGSATPVDGIISTRRGNGSAWLMMQGQPVVGTWTLSLPVNSWEVRQLFAEEKIEDMLLVITFAGQLPEWPE